MSKLTKNAGSRIESLLDAQSFVEIGSYVSARSTDFNMQTKETPADGVVTGYGTIEGNLVYVYSQDASVLGGSVGEMHAKKISQVYSMAMKMGAPVIGIIDCAGLRLQEATDALNALGSLYLDQVNASGVIPQITMVMGNCGGGMAVIPAITDFTFMETKAKMFVNSPNAIDGNISSKCDTASAEFKDAAGTVDVVGDEAELIEKVRTLVSILPANNEDDMSYDETSDDLNRVCEGIEGFAGDTSAALSMISDDNFLFETKAGFAKEMVTGFIRLNGNTVGVVANRSEIVDEEGNITEKFDSVLTADGCYKAAGFINFCDAFNIPVLSLTSVKGYKATKAEEVKIAKAAAKLICSFAGASVPKVNVIVGEAYGTSYVAMNSKAIGADITFAWPDSSIGMMDAASAAKIIYADEIAAGNGAEVVKEKAAEYAALQSNIVSAARRGYVDNIIEPKDTRKYVIGAFEMLFTKMENRPNKKHGTV